MHDIAKRRLLYVCPGVERVAVQRDVEFRGSDGAPLLMDVYSPPDAPPHLPTVVIVAGYRDEGFQARLGCRFKEMQSSVSWAEAIAASGMRAVTYTNRQPAADLHEVLARVREDTDRIGVWASSGNGPAALSTLVRTGAGSGSESGAARSVRCAALFYTFTLGAAVDAASATFGFANPCTGVTIADLCDDVPIFLARAGKDQFAGLNDALDAFVTAGLALNLPLTVVNHPDGPHAFDLFDDSAATRVIASQALDFLRSYLETDPVSS